MIVNVRFIGGPFDGLDQGWSVQRKLPQKLRMSHELGQSRGGIRMSVTSPSASGALLASEKAPDETLYRQRQVGIYYHDPIAEDFEVILAGTGPQA